MPVHEHVSKAELIDRVAALVHSKLPDAEAGPCQDFVRQFYAHVPPHDIRDSDANNLYGAAVSFWKFAQDRTPGRPKIRVFNPRYEQHGWKSSHTVIEIVNDDMPFLVDSVTTELNRQGLTVHLIIHPIVHLRRDTDGRLSEFLDADADVGDAPGESFMHIQVDEETEPETLAAIEDGLDRVLADVRAAVTDWQPMRARIADTIAQLKSDPPKLPEDEVAEAIAFLEWMEADHFTFLGYREYETVGGGKDAKMTVVPEFGLGVLANPEIHLFEGVRSLAKLPADVRKYLMRKQLLIINKTNLRATVHRGVHMDSIGVKHFDASGKVRREQVFVGLFTSTVYNRSPRFTPVLRKKLDNIVGRSGFRPSSHDGKALLHILETFPRDELFQASEDELFEICMGILHLQERQRIALFVRNDSFQRFVSCLVYVPRERFSTDLRLRFHAILEREFGGPITAYAAQLSEDSVLGRLHFLIKTTPGAVPDYDVAQIERQLVEAGRSWSDTLKDALVEARGEEKGLKRHRAFGAAFPASYRERFDIQTAVIDIEKARDVLEFDTLGLNLYRPLEDPETAIRFKIYNRGAAVPLSDVLPVLENMGLRILDEVPFEIAPEGKDTIWVHDFGMEARSGAAVDLGQVRDRFHEAFARIWAGEMENDGFNGLVIGAALHWREVVVLRTYAKYLRQAAVPFSQSYVEETLLKNPHLARLIVDLFHARFDLERAAAEKRVATILADIETALADVASLDEDRIIRRFVNLVQSTLRTNFHQTAEGGGPKPYLSLKLDSLRVDDLPLPRPMMEIFVHSPRTEGVHLRGGKVARGGIRWSDRREDFRTEVLGLMKAQMVKNAVIVPVGSKGGFVVKRPPVPGADPQANREALQHEVIACYKTLIRGMLDVTDNFVGDALTPPTQVVRHDDDDPYLVVAADKGTATFSDIANEVSAEYGFWLGDAFASGGSQGYDHKKMGITARGGWEAVKRHFRELGKDVQNEAFTVVGIGDMSGDVFGNGMLLSRHIRLVGAFNHLHVFVDPDPDPHVSFEERRRLFELPRSSWADYDRAKLSKGGAVFERSAKSVQLTPEIKSVFGIENDRLTPSELIRAMLRAPVELLWFGGIGTYIKSRHESDGDVGDRTNDPVRVDACEVRAKVVGEGANLGLTQAGRIEFALGGGCLNTDAIDNSAGVDCSDHEVNIKIALGAVVANGDMTEKQRNVLLERMTDEVAELVLRDNYLQTQALTLAHRRNVVDRDQTIRFMRALERAGKLDRAVEGLPDDETLSARVTAGQGFTRPELAVLLAYAKITLYDELLNSDLPDEPLLEEDLLRYFPEPIRKKHAAAVAAHRLRREVLATTSTNSLINRAGITFFHDMQEESGLPASQVARAYLITRDVFHLRDLWLGIEALDNQVPAAAQTDMLLASRDLVSRATLWFLRNGDMPLDISKSVDRYGSLVGRVGESLDDMLDADARKPLAQQAAALEKQGVPKDLAKRVAWLEPLFAACDIARVALVRDVEVEIAGQLYFAAGRRFGLDWLRRAADGIARDGHWTEKAVAAIFEDLYAHQYELTVQILDATDGAVDKVDAALGAWSAPRQAVVDRTARLLDDLRSGSAVDLAMLAVANRQLRSMVSG